MVRTDKSSRAGEAPSKIGGPLTIDGRLMFRILGVVGPAVFLIFLGACKSVLLQSGDEQMLFVFKGAVALALVSLVIGLFRLPLLPS